MISNKKKTISLALKFINNLHLYLLALHLLLADTSFQPSLKKTLLLAWLNVASLFVSDAVTTEVKTI